MRQAGVYGYRPEGTHPCAGIMRYRRRERERFLSTSEIHRLGEVLAHREADHPRAVAIILLLLLTGCRGGEIVTLKWRFYREGKLFLPDGKTGLRTVWLSSAARAPRRFAPQGGLGVPLAANGQPFERGDDRAGLAWHASGGGVVAEPRRAKMSPVPPGGFGRSASTAVRSFEASLACSRRAADRAGRAGVLILFSRAMSAPDRAVAWTRQGLLGFLASHPTAMRTFSDPGRSCLPHPRGRIRIRWTRCALRDRASSRRQQSRDRAGAGERGTGLPALRRRQTVQSDCRLLRVRQSVVRQSVRARLWHFRNRPG